MTPLKSDRLSRPAVPPYLGGGARLPGFSRVFHGSCRAVVGFLLLAAIVLGAQQEPARAQTTATYTVTFTGNWTTSSTTVAVPGGAHFTTLIGAVHNSDVTFWESGGTATDGVELVAEIGGTSTFESEITAAGEDVRSKVKQSGTSATGSRTFEVTFSRTHPLLTLLSMIGPSPDWFVGVSGLSMLDGSNWRSSLTRDLFAYDAGTEDGENFSLSNPNTNPQGTITSLKNMGKFTNTRMARLSFTLKTPPPPPPPPPPPEEEVCAVSEVTNDRRLSRFVECAAERIENSDTFEETLRLLEEFRDDEGDWNDGSKYLVLLTKRGGVYFHANDRKNDRKAEDLDWSGILSCEGGGDILETDVGEGCFIEYGGERSGYAHPFSASSVPLAHGTEEFVLLGGFDGTPEGKPFTGEIDGPSTEAGDVDTDEELREFVGEGGRALMVAIMDSGIDPAQLRGVLRQEGPWREGDVHIYIMDETGRVIFDGADREREQKDESAKQHVKDLIAEAGEGIIEYTEGDMLKRGYAVSVESPVNEEGNSHVYIVGSGYRVEEPEVEEPDVEEPPGVSDSGGGGCALGRNGNDGAFGLFLMVLALLFAVSLKRHLAENNTR